MDSAGLVTALEDLRICFISAQVVGEGHCAVVGCEDAVMFRVTSPSWQTAGTKPLEACI
jgi:hypothetical protein